MYNPEPAAVARPLRDDGRQPCGDNWLLQVVTGYKTRWFIGASRPRAFIMAVGRRQGLDVAIEQWKYCVDKSDQTRLNMSFHVETSHET